MRCPSCGAEQPAGATMCVACGSPLAQQTQGGGFNQGPPPCQQNPYQNQNPYGYNPYQNNPYNNPYGDAGQGNFAAANANKDAQTALICGLVGLFCCFIVGIFGITKGVSANKQLKSMGLPNSGSATAGIILGIISIVLEVFGLLFYLIYFVAYLGSIPY